MAEYRIENLNKSYQIDGKSYPVLEDLNLIGNTDELTVILGRSGCGKTTLLKILCGLETKDAGTLLFPRDKKFSMVFQEPRLMSWLNTEKNITFGLLRHRIDRKKIEALIRMAGLEGFESAYPAQLSGGMKHRVALARALACEPEMILMDEPFAALDYFTRTTMQEELLRIHQKTGMGGIFVTHNIDEAILLGDHICIMAEGRIIRSFHQPASEGGRDLLSAGAIALKQQILAGFDQTAKV